MPVHNERRYLDYSPEELFYLVADVEKYPEFLPWCQDLQVIGRNDMVLKAEMVIGFKFFREKFTSQVTLTPSNRIDVIYLNGPFKHLNNSWVFFSY